MQHVVKEMFKKFLVIAEKKMLLMCTLWHAAGESVVLNGSYVIHVGKKKPGSHNNARTFYLKLN